MALYHIRRLKSIEPFYLTREFSRYLQKYTTYFTAVRPIDFISDNICGLLSLLYAYSKHKNRYCIIRIILSPLYVPSHMMNTCVLMS